MKQILAHFGKFILRTPFFSYNSVASTFHKLQHHQVDEFLLPYLSRPEVREALFIASPDFAKEVDLYLAGELSREKMPQRHEKFADTAVKYIIRMATRPTPFGLFAGCGLGEVKMETLISPSADQPLVRKIRLDTGYLISLYEYILHSPGYLPWLKYYPNNTIYPLGDRNRYVEFYTDGAGLRIYNLSSFEKNEYIDQILDTCKGGCNYEEILSLLIDDEITSEEAGEFVQELIRSRILISELEPLIVGEEYDKQFLRVLKDVLERNKAQDNPQLDELKEIYSILYHAAADIMKLEASPGYAADAYAQLNEKLNSLQSHFSNKNLLQVDAALQCTAAPAISEELAQEVVNGINHLLRFSKTFKSSKLRNFYTEFNKRYEGRMVPLVEVMDPEVGIGYNTLDAGMLDYSTLVDDVPIPNKPGANVTNINWDMDIHTFFFNKVLEAYKIDATVIRLTDAEIGLFAPNTDLPATVNAFVNIAITPAGTPLIRYQMMGGSTAAAIIGRFSFLDPEIGTLAKAVAGHEKDYYKNSIVAEITHLSDSKAGNIAIRDSLREYEIPYVTKSNSHEEGLITVNDLCLYARDGRMVLYSKRLQKAVIPRLSNAHNYHMNTLPAYKFLSDYQGEEEGGGYNLHLDLGQINEFFEFVPRIQYKNFIYATAQWSLKTDEIKKISKQPDKEAIPALISYLSDKKISRKFYLVERGDNELLFDMDSEISMMLFLHETSKDTKIQLRECIFETGANGVVQNGSGSFYHEMVMPLKHTVIPAVVERKAPTYSDRSVKRSFLPGEEWLYLKIYSGIDTADKIIQNVLPAYITEAKEKYNISAWFFLRYADPDPHIRLRIRKDGHTDELMALLYEALDIYLQGRLVTKVCVDTYDRELERYGYDTIEYAEALFQADSELSLQLLQYTSNFSDASLRWKCSMKAIDTYLEAFGMDIGKKYDFVKRMRDGFAAEFNANKMQKRKIINKYRADKEAVDLFFDINSQNELAVILESFRQTAADIYQQAFRQTADPEYYLNSFIHMHVVRLFRSKNRLTEYILYSYLEQYFRYEIGKRKHLNYAG